MKEERQLLTGQSRIGIANRGEPALRFIRAVQEYNVRNQTHLRTVAFYQECENDAPFVQEADVAVPLSRWKRGAYQNSNPYLDKELLIEVLSATSCNAVWVGWGFLSEDAAFVRAVEDNDFVFIGPSSASMELLGDKVQAKKVAEEAGVPVVPWSKEPVTSLEEARTAAETIGYPCIIKAANAGGGRGIRFVHSPEELESRYNSAREETIRVTGGDALFLERLVETGRHLEVQVLADHYGNISTFGVRDCSVQRRNQKILEETPPPHLDSHYVGKIESAAERLIQRAAYRSAGTVEFLYDVDREEFYFMEVNTRLQVEHPITEELFGVDLVVGQLRVAAGESLEDGASTARGSVIEVRLNAEDPDQEFSPSPGKVTWLRFPAGPGIRIDSGIQQGSLIPQEFDSMVAKVIAAGKDREEARARLKRALDELRIRIEGGTTNRAFLLQLLENPRIIEGGVHTRFVEQYLREKTDVITREHWDVALLAAAVEKYEQFREEELINFKQQLAFNGQPRDISTSDGHPVNLTARGIAYQFLVKAVGGGYYHIDYAEGMVAAQYVRGEQESLLFYNEKRYRVQSVMRGDTLQCEVDGIPYIVQVESSGYVSAPSPSMVLAVPVTPGAYVEKGEVLASLEAMKMEMIVSAPEPGIVREVLVKTGEQVAAGQPLVKIESEKESEDRSAAGKPQISFHTIVRNSEGRWKVLEREYRAVFLGYDHMSEPTNVLTQMQEFVDQDPEYGHRFLDVLVDGIRMYSAIEMLFSTSPLRAEEVAVTISFSELLSHYFRREVDREKGLPQEFITTLENALSFYHGREESDLEAERRALLSMYKSHADLEKKQALLQDTLVRVEQFSIPAEYQELLSNALDQIVVLTHILAPSLADAAYHARYVLVDKSILQSMRTSKRAKVGRILELILQHADKKGRYERHMHNIVDSGHYVNPDLIHHALSAGEKKRELAWEILSRRFVRDREYIRGDLVSLDNLHCYISRSRDQNKEYTTVVHICDQWEPEKIIPVVTGASLDHHVAGTREEWDDSGGELIVLIQTEEESGGEIDAPASLAGQQSEFDLVSVGLYMRERLVDFRNFESDSEGILLEDKATRKMNPVQRRELRVQRLANFEQEQLYTTDSVFLLKLTARENPRDERFIALVDVPSARMELDENRAIKRMVPLENVLMEAVFAMRAEQARRKRRLYWNRIVIHIRAVLNTTLDQVRDYAGKVVVRMKDLGLEKFTVYSRRPAQRGEGREEIQLDFENISGTNFALRSRTPSSEPLEPMDEYIARVVRARQRGTIYPYEIVKMITRSGYQVTEAFPRGEFEEYDIEVGPDTGEQRIVSVKDRPYGNNQSNIVFGIVTNYLDVHPQGVRRVLILSDTTRDMGALAEDECRRIIAALDMAEEQSLSVEWLPVSAGARIDMDSGTENLDWTASALKRIIRFTQNGGEINIIVAGINVGAQSYWNAEATMLMHTKGLLIMTEDAAMLLTGKKALDFSGSVSAEDNIGIGGAKRIMGPNGQCQIPVKDLYEAYTVLFKHYAITYHEAGRSHPVPIESADPPERDVSTSAYHDTLGQGFSTIGDIFSSELNPERKKPFDMRQLMHSVIDSDTDYLERWNEMKDGETAIVWEVRIGGYAAGCIGIESRALARIGSIPHDGPETWSGGTLYPLSSKKVARAINAFSGTLPLVIFANLSGFDGSPESLRKLQLEYGAEIGRAMVNFRGPIIFVVTARYHGGAYVVFSKALNPRLHAVALEGAYASVIGGAPAAAVVFPRQVRKAVYSDARVIEAREKLQAGKNLSQKQFDELVQQVHTEKQKEIADTFNSIHSVERAKQVGSIDEIISVSELRKYIIETINKDTQDAG